MMSKEPKKNSKDLVLPETKENAPVLIDPEKQVEFATRAAKALKAIVSSKPKKIMINNEQYLEFEDWQTIARFYNITVGADWTKEIMREGKLVGFEAKANVCNALGTIISSAEASCLRDEANWATKPEFQLKSMAQTRASAKALRNVLAWVVVLAGYKPTPAEEMTNNRKSEKELPTIQYGEHGEPLGVPNHNPKRKTISKDVVPEMCPECKVNPISKAEKEYSKRIWNFPACRKCQANLKKPASK